MLDRRVIRQCVKAVGNYLIHIEPLESIAIAVLVQIAVGNRAGTVSVHDHHRVGVGHRAVIQDRTVGMTSTFIINKMRVEHWSDCIHLTEHRHRIVLGNRQRGRTQMIGIGIYRVVAGTVSIRVFVHHVAITHVRTILRSLDTRPSSFRINDLITTVFNGGRHLGGHRVRRH